MDDPFEEIRRTLKLLDEPMRSHRELARQLGGLDFAGDSRARLEMFRAFETIDRERTASLLATGLAEHSISKTLAEIAHEQAIGRNLASTFDDLGYHEETRRRLLEQALQYDRGILAPASLAEGWLADTRSLFERAAIAAPLWEDALRAADLAKEFALPDRLEAFRASSDLYAYRLTLASAVDHWREPSFLTAFGEATAVAALLEQSRGVTRELIAAGHEFLASPPPVLGSLADYRQFLDAAGLALPRMPRIRIVSSAEKRRRIRDRLKRNVAPEHVKRARTLVHKYELTLRASIDAAMAGVYGDDWAEQRLDVCGCKDLLGRWRKRGGEPLDHADYAHYERIMSHSDHYDAVFALAFEDPDELRALIARAGRLRAASHHPHAFTREDLRELRLVWRTIEAGLTALIDDYEIDSWG